MPQRLSGETREVERHLLRNLRKSACQTGVDRDLPWDELAVSQHHGLPTRLLDLSWLEDLERGAEHPFLLFLEPPSSRCSPILKRLWTSGRCGTPAPPTR